MTSIKGVPDRRPGRARSCSSCSPSLLSRTVVRPARLRGRRQRRGGPPGRHQRAADQAALLRHLLDASRRSAGILLASRDNSVSPTTGGGETLLYAVGAAVIGGTSLFGGKGKPVDAVIGGLVVAVIANGMGLLNKSAAVVYMVTGVVLLLAAGVDALSAASAPAASGRAASGPPMTVLARGARGARSEDVRRGNLSHACCRYCTCTGRRPRSRAHRRPRAQPQHHRRR